MMDGLLDRDEFFDVIRDLKPHLTREEFEKEWAEFQRLKAERLAKRKVN